MDSSAKAILPYCVTWEPYGIPGFRRHLMMLENIDDLFTSEGHGPWVVCYGYEHGSRYSPIGESDSLTRSCTFDHFEELRPCFG